MFPPKEGLPGGVCATHQRPHMPSAACCQLLTTTKLYYFRLNLKNKACQSAIPNSAQPWLFWRHPFPPALCHAASCSLWCSPGAASGTPRALRPHSAFPVTAAYRARLLAWAALLLLLLLSPRPRQVREHSSTNCNTTTSPS